MTMSRIGPTIVYSILLGACGSGSEQDEAPLKIADSPAPPAAQPAAAPAPKFCGNARRQEIEAAFEFGIKLADVSVAMEHECHYNLDMPGVDMALLIYRMLPLELYEGHKGSRRQTGEIPGLAEEAILIGDAQIMVKLDKNRAFEVAVQIMSTSGEPLSISREKVQEGLRRFAGMLAVRL